jgi:hypothetical protein
LNAIDGGPSVVDARHQTLARLRLDAAGQLVGPADPDAYPADPLGDPHDPFSSLAGPGASRVDLLENHAGLPSGPGDQLAGPADPRACLACRAADFGGLVATARHFPRIVHLVGVAANHGTESPRPAASLDGLLACRGCLVEDRCGLLECPVDPGGDPVGLVAYLGDLGQNPHSGNQSVHRWDRYTPVLPTSRLQALSVMMPS